VIWVEGGHGYIQNQKATLMTRMNCPTRCQWHHDQGIYINCNGTGSPGEHYIIASATDNKQQTRIQHFPSSVHVHPMTMTNRVVHDKRQTRPQRPVMPPARLSSSYCFLQAERVPIRAMPWFIASFLRVGIRPIRRKANVCEQCGQRD
jgi:hypothetical protein